MGKASETSPAVPRPAKLWRGVRARVAFFDYPDVFEDFYPHYGVDRANFATTWSGTANHAWLALVQRDVGDVTWYCLSLSKEPLEARHRGIGCRVRFLPSSAAHRRIWHLFYGTKWSWRWRGAYRTFATVASYFAPLSRAFLQTIRRDRPEVIVVHSYASGKFDVLLMISWWLRIPLIAVHSGEVPGRYLGHFVRRWTIRRADWVFASGEAERASLCRRYRVRSDRTAVLPPAIDTELFRPIERQRACERLGLDPTRRYLLFVGRLQDSVKRVSSLIDVFAGLTDRHSEVDLVVVGDGPDDRKLRRQAAEAAPGRVRFLGWLTGAEDLACAYSVAEYLVLPSWREALPFVVAEAFACGTPVIASRVGAIADVVVEGTTGMLIPAGDDDALSAALATAIRTPETAAALRPAVREIAERQLSRAAAAEALRGGFAVVMGDRG